jgi:Protein of unknown function (DUF4236)
MGFRFQKRVSTPFGRINISKSGVSLSEGVRGVHITIGRTPRITLGIPGSGLSWTQTLPRGSRRRNTVSAPQGDRRSTASIIAWLVGLAIILGVLVASGAMSVTP